MPTLVLDIALPAERLLAVYQGQANRILVRSREGKRVSLPAQHLRPFLHFAEQGQLLGLRRLD